MSADYYRVVEGGALDSFNEEVSKLLSEGWQFSGELIVTENKEPYLDGGGGSPVWSYSIETTYRREMVRPKGATNDNETT